LLKECCLRLINGGEKEGGNSMFILIMKETMQYDKIEFDCPCGIEMLKKGHNIMWTMYLNVSEIFDKYNIKYFLIFGTLLGAVRHKGFIPWDYDFDLSVMADDYDRAIELLRENYSDIYIFNDSISEPKYFRKYEHFCQILHKKTEIVKSNNSKWKVSIDIYRTREEMRWSPFIYKHRHSYTKLKFLLMDIQNNNKIFKSILKLIYHSIISMFWWNVAIISPKKRMYVVDPEREKPFETGWLLPFSTVEFNGKLCPAPNIPEKMLEYYYGNWKDVPSYEGRRVHIKQIIIED